jgi:hypothetical protein
MFQDEKVRYSRCRVAALLSCSPGLPAGLPVYNLVFGTILFAFPSLG